MSSLQSIKKNTKLINDRNLSNVRQMIEAKTNYLPYYATESTIKGVITDYDTFPYPRFFRGVYNSSTPIIAEREAGFRQRYDTCYKDRKTCTEPCEVQPVHCFESACSTVFPCYPANLQKYADQDLLDVMLNKACVVQYR
jgi:hypothetical protein